MKALPFPSENGVGDGDGVSVGAGVGVGVGEAVGVGVGVGEAVGVGVGVGVGEAVGLGVGEGVSVGATVGDGEGVGVTMDTPPTKLSASPMSRMIEPPVTLKLMWSIVTVRPLPLTLPSVERVASGRTVTVPETTPAMLTATSPGVETTAHGESALCLMQRLVICVPVSLLLAPLPVSTLFDWATIALAVTTVVPPMLRTRPLVVEVQLELTWTPPGTPEQLVVAAVAASDSAPCETLRALAEDASGGESMRLTLAVATPSTDPWRVRAWPLSVPSSCVADASPLPSIDARNKSNAPVPMTKPIRAKRLASDLWDVLFMPAPSVPKSPA